MAAICMARPAIGANSSVFHRAEPARPSNAATLMAKTKTKASTPMVPMRLSRMISSTRSRGRALRNPSAVSAKPSKCSPPLNADSRPITKRSRNSPVTPSFQDTKSPNMHSPPMINPTKGNQAGDRSKSRSSNGARMGMTVKNCNAARKGFMSCRPLRPLPQTLPCALRRAPPLPPRA